MKGPLKEYEKSFYITDNNKKIEYVKNYFCLNDKANFNNKDLFEYMIDNFSNFISKIYADYNKDKDIKIFIPKNKN